MNTWKIPSLLAALAFAAPAQLNAQACLGIPATNGQFAFQAGVGLSSGTISYGASLTANFNGPLSAGLGYTYTDFDDYEGGEIMPADGPKGNTVSANVALEISGINFSACPILGMEYSRVTGVYLPFAMGPYATVTSVVVPAGFGAGITLPVARSWRLTPFGASQVLYIHSEAQAEYEGWTSSKHKDDAVEAGWVFGILFGSERIQVGGSAALTTIEGSDPSFKLGLSLVL
jgi:hypothetical protein